MNENQQPNLFRLDGRVVMITGAAGHLGAPIAKAVAGVGGIPILCGRTESKLQELAGEIFAVGAASMVIAFDVGDSEACKDAVCQVEKKFGKLHGLVNCAYSGRPATLEESTELDFEIACRQNLIGPFLLAQASRGLLKEAAQECLGGSSVVNIATMYASVSPDPRIYGISGKNNPPYYGATKAGLIQLSRYLAVHFGPQNIRVNSVSPGPFPHFSLRETQPEFHKKLCDKSPMGRIGRPEELVGSIIFLLSDASSYVTGVDLPVDGGWTAW